MAPMGQIGTQFAQATHFFSSINIQPPENRPILLPAAGKS